MNHDQAEVCRQHNRSLEKHVYFLLAAASGGVTLAMHRTTTSSLHWMELFLGLAVVCWCLSFLCGCHFLGLTRRLLRQNGIYLASTNDSPNNDLELKVFQNHAGKTNNSASQYFDWQSYLFLIGVGLFLVWHAVGMVNRTFTHQKMIVKPIVAGVRASLAENDLAQE